MEENNNEKMGLLAEGTIEDMEFEYYVQDWLGANHSVINYNRKTKPDNKGRPTVKQVLVKVKKMGHDLKERVVARAVDIRTI